MNSKSGDRPSHTRRPKTWTFSEHKETTAADCEAVAKSIQDIAAMVREGNMAAFEEYWIEGGTEEGDAKINSVRELIVLRYTCRIELSSFSVEGSSVSATNNDSTATH